MNPLQVPMPIYSATLQELNPYGLYSYTAFASLQKPIAMFSSPLQELIPYSFRSQIYQPPLIILLKSSLLVKTMELTKQLHSLLIIKLAFQFLYLKFIELRYSITRFLLSTFNIFLATSRESENVQSLYSQVRRDAKA